jgi:hypothetical protein
MKIMRAGIDGCLIHDLKLDLNPEPPSGGIPLCLATRRKIQRKRRMSANRGYTDVASCHHVRLGSSRTRALDLAVPPSVLARADEAIE